MTKRIERAQKLTRLDQVTKSSSSLEKRVYDEEEEARKTVRSRKEQEKYKNLFIKNKEQHGKEKKNTQDFVVGRD